MVLIKNMIHLKKFGMKIFQILHIKLKEKVSLKKLNKLNQVQF
jgi:hypothetical protein